MNKNEQIISDRHDGQRIDNVLSVICKGVPKSRLYRAVRQGEIRLNKGRIKASSRVKNGDILRLPPQLRQSSSNLIQPGSAWLDKVASAVLYQDQYLAVFNKPSGMAVHGGSGIGYGLIEGLNATQWAGVDSWYLVHRLDRGTSGCLVLAKNRLIASELMQDFKDRQVKKGYLAWVYGRVPWERKVCDLSLSSYKTSASHGFRVCVDAEGQVARTDFEVVLRQGNVTLLSCWPLTGRTHQIRVHAEALGFPIIGDTRYGQKQNGETIPRLESPRLLLHAASIIFNCQGRRYGFCSLFDRYWQTFSG